MDRGRVVAALTQLRTTTLESIESLERRSSDRAAATEIDWPPTLRAELEGIQAPRRPWYLTVGPAYLTIFRLGPVLRPALAERPSRAADSGVCRGGGRRRAGLFRPVLSSGRDVGIPDRSAAGCCRRLDVRHDRLGVAHRLALAVAELVWYAVAIDYAVDSTFSGWRLADSCPRASSPPGTSARSSLRGPIFLCTAMFWIFITGMAGMLRLSGVIARS